MADVWYSRPKSSARDNSRNVISTWRLSCPLRIATHPAVRSTPWNPSASSPSSSARRLKTSSAIGPAPAHSPPGVSGPPPPGQGGRSSPNPSCPTRRVPPTCPTGLSASKPETLPPSWRPSLNSPNQGKVPPNPPRPMPLPSSVGGSACSGTGSGECSNRARHARPLAHRARPMTADGLSFSCSDATGGGATTRSAASGSPLEPARERRHPCPRWIAPSRRSAWGRPR